MKIEALPPPPSKQHEDIRFTNPNQMAFLDVHGIPGSYENHGGVVIMAAPRTEEVLQLIDAFNQNGTVPVISFITSLQAVKKKIYSLRSSRPAGR